MYQQEEFKDRKAKNPNKRRITILEQNSNEIIANIEPVAEEIEEEGTVFNAALMNKFQDSIIQSETDSETALRIANEAKAQSQEAYNHVVSMQGTRVTENGSFVANFDADKKVSTETYNSDKNELKARLSALETNPLMTMITYDGTTNTFCF